MSRFVPGLILILSCLPFGAVQAETAAGDAAAPPPAEAPAKPAPAPFDTDEPIDISADEVDVRQNERLVVFSGNVVALQGDMRLAADKISVHYSGGDSAAAEDEGGVAGRIERLEANGNVTVTRPDQVVRAASAYYRMADNQVVMSGNVTATHKKNVINSEKVIVDLKANTIRLGAKANEGRVKGLFVPDSKSKPKTE